MPADEESHDAAAGWRGALLHFSGLWIIAPAVIVWVAWLYLFGPGPGLVAVMFAFAIVMGVVSAGRLVVRFRESIRQLRRARARQSPSERATSRRIQLLTLAIYAPVLALGVTIGLVRHSVVWALVATVGLVGVVMLAMVPVLLISSLRAERAVARQHHQ